MTAPYTTLEEDAARKKAAADLAGYAGGQAFDGPPPDLGPMVDLGGGLMGPASAGRQGGADDKAYAGGSKTFDEFGASRQAGPTTPKPSSYGIPSGVAPPPPAPPPPPPDLNALRAQMNTFASQGLAEPNRYLGDVATAVRTAGDSRLAKAEADAKRGIGEWAQGRGLIGSSYEGEQVRNLESDLQRNRQQQEADLLTMIANANAMDRQGAASTGLATIASGENAGLPGRAQTLEEKKFAEQQKQNAAGTGFTQQEIDLKARALQQEAALQGRQLDITAARDQATQALERDRLTQQGSQFEKTLNISQQDVDLRAKQIQDQEAQAGRSMNIQEAQNKAQNDIARENMQLQVRLQTNELDQRAAQFAASLGLDTQKFVASQDQFAKQYGEQLATRLQQNAQFQTALQSENARAAVDAGLRSRALDLQQQGMSAEQAFRQASLDQEKVLTLSAQDLTRQGMSQENAYRYAALSQDAKFRAEANMLTQQGMSLDQAYRTAQLSYNQRQLDEQKRQFDADLAFRKWYTETDPTRVYEEKKKQDEAAAEAERKRKEAEFTPPPQPPTPPGGPVTPPPDPGNPWTPPPQGQPWTPPPNLPNTSNWNPGQYIMWWQQHGNSPLPTNANSWTASQWDNYMRTGTAPVGTVNTSYANIMQQALGQPSTLP